MSGINPGDEKLVFESSEAVQVCRRALCSSCLLIGVRLGCIDV